MEYVVQGVNNLDQQLLYLYYDDVEVDHKILSAFFFYLKQNLNHIVRGNNDPYSTLFTIKQQNNLELKRFSLARSLSLSFSTRRWKSHTC